MKIIVPIRSRSFAEWQSKIEQVAGRADVIEVWLDVVSREDFFFEKFKTFIEAWDERGPAGEKIKFLGVCKMLAEQGAFEGTVQERGSVLQRFLEAGGDFIDLDIIQNTEKLIHAFPSEKLFLSFHDFSGRGGELNNVFVQQKRFNPIVYKFAVTTNTHEELNRFLTFVEPFPKEKKAIFTTMGILGERGRELILKSGKSWGAFYALDAKSRTARGQAILATFLI